MSVAEDVVEGDRSLTRLLVLAFDQLFSHFALQAGRQADQSLRMLGEKLLADARLVVEAVQRCLGDDLHQVAVAFVALGEHNQVVVAVAFGRGAMVVLLADVELAPEDWLDAGFLCRVDELDGSEDIAVVGHGDRGHAEFLYPVDELLGFAGSVEHGVIGMQMEVNEFGHCGVALFYSMRRSGPCSR